MAAPEPTASPLADIALPKPGLPKSGLPKSGLPGLGLLVVEPEYRIFAARVISSHAVYGEISGSDRGSCKASEHNRLSMESHDLDFERIDHVVRHPGQDAVSRRAPG